MANCDGCNKVAELTGAVLGGRFGHYCAGCIAGAVRNDDPRLAQYERDRDLDAHAADILTPWTQRGKPHKDFIRLYPEEAKQIFTKEELENYG